MFLYPSSPVDRRRRLIGDPVWTVLLAINQSRGHLVSPTVNFRLAPPVQFHLLGLSCQMASAMSVRWALILLLIGPCVFVVQVA